MQRKTEKNEQKNSGSGKILQNKLNIFYVFGL